MRLVTSSDDMEGLSLSKILPLVASCESSTMRTIGTTNASTSTMTSCFGVLIGDWWECPLMRARRERGKESAHYSACCDILEAMTRSVCLFCSAKEDLPAPSQRLAAEFGAACAREGIRLVYGGSGRGLMGVAARAAVAAGGDVLGIMPRHLMRPEHAAADLGTLVIVETLAERKQKMTDAADLFVAIPGGIGTLNELIEMLTLNDLGLQAKPVILCATDGFWEPFIALMERFRDYGVLRPSIAQFLRSAASVEETMQFVDELLPAERVAESR